MKKKITYKFDCGCTKTKQLYKVVRKSFVINPLCQRS